MIGFLCFRAINIFTTRTFFLFLFVTSMPVTEKSGLLLNGAVHALMYYHFAFRLPRWLRPLITAAQIVQLAVVTFAWIDCSRRCDEAVAYRRAHPLDYRWPFLTVPVYLALFVKFLSTSTCSRASRARARRRSFRRRLKRRRTASPAAAARGVGR